VDARELLLAHRDAATPVVVGRAVGSDEQRVTVTTLGEFDPAEVDMRCLVIIGSSQSVVVRDRAGRAPGDHPAPVSRLARLLSDFQCVIAH